jgi:hypothetical protein
MNDLKYDAIVIGGGFFGCTIALHLKNYVKDILLLEKESDLLQRASYINQARVHHGYHYPRSILTAVRSKINFPRFVKDYQDCIVSNFDNYYAVSRNFSKINAKQFQTFCDRLDIPWQIASDSIQKLFNKKAIEAVFITQEYVFDAVKLKQKLYQKLADSKIKYTLQAEVTHLKNLVDDGGMEVKYNLDGEVAIARAKYVFNCTYSNINTILAASHLPIIPLKHELAEMSLVRVPEAIKDLGITVMCGNFFSLMPFPAKGLHSLSHVRCTPHCNWQDTESLANPNGQIYHRAVRKTNYPYKIRDACRYVPILKDCSYVDSLWEIKTILPQSEVDDSRPILWKRNAISPNLICILGAKIDNVYDVCDELRFLEREGFASS